MNPTPWYIVVNVIAIIIYLFCVFIVAIATAAVVWTLRTLDRTISPGVASVIEIERCLKGLPEDIKKAAEAAKELQELKEGDMRIIGALVKATNELRESVEEFHAALFSQPPVEKVKRRGTGGLDEQREIVAEKRRAEQAAYGDPSLQEILESKGKHGGTV